MENAKSCDKCLKASSKMGVGEHDKRGEGNKHKIRRETMMLLLLLLFFFF
jgi:hypothetical protein